MRDACLNVWSEGGEALIHLVRRECGSGNQTRGVESAHVDVFSRPGLVWLDAACGAIAPQNKYSADMYRIMLLLRRALR